MARLRRAFDVLVSRRYVVLGFVAAAAWAGQIRVNGGYGADWAVLLTTARSFSTAPPNGDVVAPLALLLIYPFTALSVQVGWIVCSLLCMAVGVLVVRLLEQTAETLGLGSSLQRQQSVLVGGVVLLWAWSQPGAQMGHADDVLALTSVAVAVRAVARGHWLVSSIVIAAGIDAKPWVVLVLPLLAACPGRTVRSVAVAGVLAVVPWIPFLVVQHGHLGDLNLVIAPGSALHFLGASGSPGWPRDLQIAVALPLGAWAVVRRQWYLVPSIVFAVRFALDPRTYSYYATGAVLGMLLWDVVRPLRAPGIRTALACLALIVLPDDLETVHAYPEAAVIPVVLLRFVAIAAPVVALSRSSQWDVMPVRGSPT
jgi:hypothetical protein